MYFRSAAYGLILFLLASCQAHAGEAHIPVMVEIVDARQEQWDDNQEVNEVVERCLQEARYAKCGELADEEFEAGDQYVEFEIEEGVNEE